MNLLSYAPDLQPGGRVCRGADTEKMRLQAGVSVLGVWWWQEPAGVLPVDLDRFCWEDSHFIFYFPSCWFIEICLMIPITYHFCINRMLIYETQVHYYPKEN